MGKATGDLKRGQPSRWPHELTIITDTGDDSYDHREALPIEPAAVLNLAAVGLVQAVSTRPEGNDLLIVDGMQRTKRALVINHLTAVHEYRGKVRAVHECIKLMKDSAEGRRVVELCPKGMKIAITVFRGTAGEAYSGKASANEFREDDPIVNKARKVQRLFNKFNYTHEECAEMYKVHVATIKRWLAMDTEKERPARKARTKSTRPTIRRIAKAYETATGKPKTLLGWVCGKASFEDAVKAFPELDAS